MKNHVFAMTSRVFARKNGVFSWKIHVFARKNALFSSRTPPTSPRTTDFSTFRTSSCQLRLVSA